MDVDSNGFDLIKSFISTVKEYNNQRSEAVSQKLQRYLQILSTISDSNVFDPNNADGAEFYVSLHDVMSTLDSRTGLMWCAVSVLEEACKNPAAQHALIHTYKFTPILTQLLSGHLIHDKQLKVLRLLQEFTYGVKILWQEAHLPLLISILTKWIKDSDRSPEIVTLSLGVLVNLCYKNLPAVYTLRRVIDIKDFMNSVLSQRKDILDIRVQAYKMTIILEEVSGEVSDTEILACVTWTFKRMHEAFENGSVNAMRHLVDLFKDIKENDNLKSVLLKYPSYSSDTDKLLQLLENKIGDAVERNECVVLLLEFVQSVISLCPSEMESFYEPLVKLSLTINGINAQISQIALQVICTLMVETRKQGKNINPSVITILETALPVLLCTLNMQDVKVSDRNATTALLGLLLELSQESTMGKRILSSLQPQVVKNYFLEMLSSDSQENDNLFDETSTTFYLQALSLVSALSVLEEQWKLLLSELLQHKKVKVRLAAALYTGSSQVKLEVLQLITQLGCDNRLLAELSQCMAELDKLMSPAASHSNNGFCIQQNLSNLTGHRSSPLLSQAQHNRLDQCITTVQQAIAKNELGTVGTAAVLELYEYRVAAMSHTESVLQGNLQAVDTYCTQLRHRLSVMSTKVNKLLSVLHDKEQNLEVCKKTNNKLQHDLTEVKAVQDKYSQELEMNNIKIEELTKELTMVNKKFKELQELEITYKKELEQQREKISTMEGEILNLENVVGDKEERIKQKCKELKEATSIIQNREMKIEQQEALIKGLEKMVCEKDNEISQQQSEIAELENMRNVIMKLTLEKNQGKKK